MLEQILPPEVVVVETDHDEPGALLFPDEEAVIARAVQKRRREFTAGRACARRALARSSSTPSGMERSGARKPAWTRHWPRRPISKHFMMPASARVSAGWAAQPVPGVTAASSRKSS